MTSNSNQAKPGFRDEREEVPETETDFAAELRPETELERQILADPRFVRGLKWGKPRFGHPEGEIWKHIQEVFTNIDQLGVQGQTRHRLRIIAMVHDTFKYLEDRSWPRDWSRHHGVFARKFLSHFIDDGPSLFIAENHDEAFYSWRMRHLFQQPAQGEARLQKLLDGLDDHLQLFYQFFWCDTLTGDKNIAPLHWFEDYVDGLELLPRRGN